jgi:PhzF family phenazine biosynthesis protein
MKQIIHVVDAFASKPFTGNPAAVCLLDGEADVSWMQYVAMEMNQAETAFLVREAEGYRLRWLTPTMEVDLCGHATIAASHLLWEIGEEAPGSTIVFHTRSGKLTAQFEDGWIELDFPAERDTPCEAPEQLVSALNVDPSKILHVGKNRFDYIIQLETADAVRNLKPNMSILGQISCRGTIVTAVSDSSDCDFISRFFAPAAGIPEDPVTGSAHCCLAPFWQQRTGKNKLTGYQASKRGGFVRVEVRGDRVILGGQAVTTLRGELDSRD